MAESTIAATRELTNSGLIAGRFSIGELILKTSRSRVYRGFDLRRNLPVILKTVTGYCSGQRIAELKREGWLLSSAIHRGVLQGAGYFFSDGYGNLKHWLIMEPAKGELLLKLMATQSGAIRSVSFRRKVVRHLIAALQALHDYGYKHGDIKPDNIFVNCKTGDVQLIDFSASQPLGQVQVVHSTSPDWQPAWLWEKQASTHPDVYGVALIVWCLWTGRHPFSGKDGIDFKVSPSGWLLRYGWRGYWLKRQLLRPGNLTLSAIERYFG